MNWNKLLVAALHLAGGMLLKHGWVHSETAYYLAGASAAVIGWLAHNSPPATVKADIQSLPGRVLKLALFAALLSVFTVGCMTSPSKSHVVRGVATGTSIGISQNPATGLYEFGVKRCQIEFVTIPIFFTNGLPCLPDVVSRYELTTHSAVFGNASLTSTLATGSNGVNTSVGGATPPINAGTGTNNMLTPLSH